MRERKELPRSIVREEGCQVASRLVGEVQQEAGEVVGETRFGRSGTGVERRLAIGEGVKTAWAESLLLQQSVANPAQVDTELKGVIADDLGPGVRKVYICFRPDPGKAGGVADQRIRKSSVIGNGDAHDSAGYRVEVYAGNAQSLGCFGAEITVVGLVVIPGHTSAELGNQRVREKAIVVETNAIGVLDAAALEIALCRSAGRTE